MNDVRSGVCFLLRRVSNTASSFLKARRLFTSIYEIIIRLFAKKKLLRIKQFEGRMWGGAKWHVITCKLKGVELIRYVNTLHHLELDLRMQ